MKLPLERRLVVLGGGAVAGLVLLYVFLYHPLFSKLNRQAAECTVLERELGESRDKMRLLRDAPRLKPFLSQAEVGLMIDELTRLARELGVAMLSMKAGNPERPEEGGEYRLLALAMETESGFEEIGNFLGALEGLEKGLATVRSFTIRPGTEDGTRLRASLTVDLYLAE